MVIDGKKIAKNLEEKLVTELLFSPPQKVCFVVFGGNAATEQFIKMKSKVAERVGIAVTIASYPKVKTTKEAVAIIKELGGNDFSGVVVQLPLAQGIDTEAVLDSVPPLKDIDVLGSLAKESYVKGKIDRTPPVAQAVREILTSQSINIVGKKVVVAGRGRLVGEPVSLMLDRMKIPHAVIDLNTSREKKLELFKNADIIISGMGVPHSIKPQMVKKGVVLIDAGTSEQNGKIAGDVDPECASKALYITTVPGGVGPITVVSLLRNLV